MIEVTVEKDVTILLKLGVDEAKYLHARMQNSPYAGNEQVEPSNEASVRRDIFESLAKGINQL